LSTPNNPAVKLGALYSGGKDSTFAIYRAREMKHQVACLITMHPAADDSMLFHYPNSWVTRLLSEAMEIPVMEFAVKGRSKDDEIKALEEAMAQAKSAYGIQGVVYGGIASNYQKQAFEEICGRLGLAAVAPLWNAESGKYMNELVKRGFKVMIVGVSAMGLGKEWLGKKLNKASLAKLAALSKKYGFNLTFEGGEAETLVTDCPLFRKKLRINSATTHWDGQRGIFEIRDVSLVEK
jgi:ABC transporter with metal-binding/Fe-S-binding domain ATP-binding protein